MHVDNRARQLKRPYSVYLEGVSSIHTKVRPTCLGTFATAEQAALVYARRTGNRAERIVAGKGRAEGTLKAIHEAAGHTVVCRRCQALVCLQVARRYKRAGAPFAKGDGCFRCSSGSRPGRLRIRQMDMAQAVQLGKRTLVAWPKTNERPRARGKPDSEVGAPCFDKPDSEFGVPCSDSVSPGARGDAGAPLAAKWQSARALAGGGGAGI